MNVITAVKKEEPAHVQTAVERSLARPDACAKPGTLGNSKVRVRVNLSKSPNPRRRKRDYRDVNFY
jgi:hypothetical protein